jgi:hypothetical protein
MQFKETEHGYHNSKGRGARIAVLSVHSLSAGRNPIDLAFSLVSEIVTRRQIHFKVAFFTVLD